MTVTLANPQAARRTRPLADPVAPRHPRVGPVDDLPAEEILALIPRLVHWAEVRQRYRATRLRAAAAILRWLQQHPGDGWQARWLTSGADDDPGWLEAVVADDPRTATTKRAVIGVGMTDLMLTRAILPDYTFLARHRSRMLFGVARKQFRPDLFARLQRGGEDMGMQQPQIHDGINAVTRIVLHTGRDVDQLTGEDVYEHREWFYRGLRGADRGVHAAWDLLREIGVLPAGTSLRHSARLGRRPVEELVDYYKIRYRPIRDVLVRYLNERAPSLDHGSLRTLTKTLAGLFWADIERHHPELHTFRLPPAVAEQWKSRLRTCTTPAGASTPRKTYQQAIARVRAFYLDLQEWAQEDPSWAAWVAPSPVRRSDLAGMQKARNKTVSEMHQRVRERLPHLAQLVDSAEAHRIQQSELLAAAVATPLGETFRYNEATYMRTVHKSYRSNPGRQPEDKILIEDIATGEQVDIARRESDAFWTWAIIETLRHTGIRIEELMEITSLAIVSYRLPDTGEVVPLLQIVPSKTNEERLLLVSPELASVLASVVKRLRDDNNGTVPLIARYDLHEKVTGPPLPHLFQIRRAWRRSVIGPSQIRRILDDALDRAGIRDATGQPLRFTPHDFRRMFTTEAVTGGLPVHIAAKLLGHHNLTTVESYLAVFQDDLIRTYRSFLDKRRALRPETEYREPTDEEWREFEQHFEQRRLELGTCGRPYGSPCQHEHACIRCPMLRVDPQQRHRLAGIIQNLNDRIAEARANGWHGEVEGLKVSLTAAANKLASLDRSQRRLQTSQPVGPVDLGMPLRLR